jgi:UDP-glucose 4-epimerase
MNILVTGGAGYIGSHLVKQLLKNNKNYITVIDNFETGHKETISTLKKFGQLKFIYQDLSEWSSLEEIFKKSNFDGVIHLAASLNVSESVINPLKYYLNNTSNTIKLIDLCNKYNINNFIFSSSAAVYGEPDISKVPINEFEKSKPINPYGNSKAFIEQIIKDNANINTNFKYVIMRYFNVAGAEDSLRIGECHEPETHLIPLVIKAALGKKSDIKIYGDDYETKDGTCIRDYIHVDDLASAHISCLDYLKENESTIFNCGYGHGYSVNEIINVIRKISGVNFNVKVVNRRLGDPAVLVADNKKILKLTNWSPIHDDLEYICKTAMDWERKNNLK